MGRLLIPFMAMFGGVAAGGEVRLAVSAVRGTTLEVKPGAPSPAASLGVPTPAPPFPGPLDLPALWALALANNPTLREAAAEVEAVRGQGIQAGKYPNPRFAYRESVLGTTQDPAGDLTLEATQEIVTGGKRRL